ncbi:hypothetical protein [Pseudoalteromonas sp. ZZD1]|uniref:hypothetical protein n=1 Tax=Pseudoalteromonas sp. ZZD1 TaxID=3139395 RepID=UPI003BAA8F86
MLAWLPHFQNFILDFIDQALLQSGILYASSRSVNAIISLLQSAEVGIGIASIQPAQLLDPVNDLAEYMSDAMRLALGSLFIQRILFSIASGVLFSALFTLSVACYVVCDYFGYLKKLSTNVLASLVLIRFLIPLVVITTGLASQVFLDDEIDTQTKAVSQTVNNLSDQAHATSALSANMRSQITSQKQTTLDELTMLSTEQHQLNKIVKDNQEQLKQLRTRIDAIQANRSLTQKLTMIELEQARPLIKQQQDLKQQQAKLNNQLAALHAKTEQLQQQVQLYNDQLAGNTGNMVSKVADAVTSGITEMVTSLEALFIDFINLLSLLVVKLILMPLLFLYIFNKAFKAIWQRSIVPSYMNEQLPNKQ